MASDRKIGRSEDSRSGSGRARRRISEFAPEREADGWRHDNIGRLLNSAVRRFEARVLELMTKAGHRNTRLSHVSLTRNLDRSGTRVTELARRSAMTKQAMGELVDQCVALGLVVRQPDPGDGRARTVLFTKVGLLWLDHFRKAVERAEHEMREEIGSGQLEGLKEALARYGAKFDVLARKE